MRTKESEERFHSEPETRGNKIIEQQVNIDSLQVGESSTAPSNRVKNLGCWFDGQLKMDTHINSICNTEFYHLHNIRRLRKFVNSECTKILVTRRLVSPKTGGKTVFGKRFLIWA